MQQAPHPRANGPDQPATPIVQGEPATDKQRSFILRLLEERDLTGHDQTRAMLYGTAMTSSLSKRQASLNIDWLLSRKPAPETSLDLLPQVTPGRYAVEDVLFRIDRPEGGRWDGWIFVKNGSAYADERFGYLQPGEGYRGAHRDALREIARDPDKARRRYAEITGNCYICGRTLEDPDSVALGIGPVCRKNIA